MNFCRDYNTYEMDAAPAYHLQYCNAIAIAIEFYD